MHCFVWCRQCTFFFIWVLLPFISSGSPLFGSVFGGGATLMTTQKTAVLIHSHQLDFLKNFKIRFAGIVFHGLRVRMG